MVNHNNNLIAELTKSFREGDSILDFLVNYADKYDLEEETVASIIGKNSQIKMLLEYEAKTRKLLKDNTKHGKTLEDII